MALGASDDDLIATLNVPMTATAESTGVRPSMRAKGIQAAVAAPVTIDEKPEVAGYELLNILGKGGEGTVWEAVEKKLERRVAIKIHARIRETESASNLWTEAKVAARIGDPSIVTVLDVGLTLDGRRYYAMELVRGTDVAEMIAKGPLTSRRAMEIAADVSRAVAAAHQHGVIHRDLKPRNVIVDAANRARVVDFGIALDLRSTGGDHLAGMIAGSPKYMAPEQVRGEAIGPATDIWAMGVLLFEMLTGHSPFQRGSMLEMLDAVVAGRFEAPSTIVPGIHRDIDAIVTRCLAVKPEERFSSASALHECLRAVLEGHEVSIAHTDETFSYHPRASFDDAGSEIPRREKADKHVRRTWQLTASPKALWPHLSDTQRFNEAVGLDPMTIVTEHDENGRIVHKATHHTLGLDLAWQEFPSEWVEERELAKFRWYSQGPFEATWTRVGLQPLENGGTELTYEVWAITRGLVGKILSYVDLEKRLARSVDKYVRRIDALCSSGKSDELGAHKPSRQQRARVSAVSTQLLAQGFDARIVRALEHRLLYAPDTALAPVRPHALADLWKLSREETTDALIHAAKHGLLVPTWSYLCPTCRVSQGSIASLAEVGEKGRCATCLTSFTNDLESSVELSFVPHPAVRAISNKTFGFDPPARRPHIRAQKMLLGRDEIALALDLPPGAYKVIANHSRATFDLLVTATGFAASTKIAYDGLRFSGGPAVVRAGQLQLRIRNTSRTEEYFRVESCEKQMDVLSAAAALTHPAFRQLFAEQLPMSGVCMPVRELAFVFVRATCRDLIARLGDARAYTELARVGDRIADEARRFQGSAVPSSPSVITLAFASPAHAIRAALAIRAMLDAGFTAGVSIAVHSGACVAVSRAGRAELFGDTLQRGEALVSACPAGEIGVSETMMGNRKVALLVYGSGRAARHETLASAGYADFGMTVLDSQKPG